ncbi:MAG: GntR family transcriptional regulator [Clostridiales bacterium]|nr:GntR family transcriptional regulator [Clostridiales bacterium]
MPHSKNVFLDPKAQGTGLLRSTDLLSVLRKDILQGKYPHGHKLTEQQICSKHKVSRTPVREALRRLEAEGLIETIPNRGAFVLGLSEQDVRDIFELRKLYEIQAVKWAARRMTDEQLEALGETIDFMEFYTQKGDVEKILNINTSFHQLIYASSHNRMLRSVLSSYQLYVAYALKARSTTTENLPLLLAEHRGIFNALKSRDMAAGVCAMEKHMDNSIERGQQWIFGE